MFWDNFCELCKAKGMSPNAVAKEIGISSGAVTSWKQGRLPRWQTLEEIATYFGVSTGDLLGKEKSPSAKAEEPVGLDKLIIDSLKTLSDEDKQKVFAMMQIFLSKKE